MSSRRSVTADSSWTLVLSLAVAAFTFIWRLGASSLFTDETSSWLAARTSLGGVFSAVRKSEVAPPSYYLLLHVWIRLTGSDSIWTMRFLSVLAGLGLVSAVWWLARLLSGEVVALLAALLTALSPLVVQYSQEIRSYVFVMLFATVAVAAAFAARRAARPRRWLVLAGVASVAAIWTHYTGLLIIVPLVLYVWYAPGFNRWARRAYAATCAAALVVVAPLIVLQLRAGHQGGVAPYARLSATNLEKVVGTPFDGRFAGNQLTHIAGAVAVVAALAYLARRLRRDTPELWFVFAASLVPVLALSAVTLAATVSGESTYDSLITRYTAVAAPFMLVALGSAIATIARPAAAALGAVALVGALSGLLATYSTQNFWPDLGGAFAYVSQHYRTGDAVLIADGATPRGSGDAHYADADYYVAALRRAHTGARVLNATTGYPVPAGARRLWVLSDLGAVPAAASALAQSGWHAASSDAFTPTAEVLLATR